MKLRKHESIYLVHEGAKISRRNINSHSWVGRVRESLVLASHMLESRVLESQRSSRCQCLNRSCTIEDSDGGCNSHDECPGPECLRDVSTVMITTHASACHSSLQTLMDSSTKPRRVPPTACTAIGPAAAAEPAGYVTHRGNHDSEARSGSATL